MRLLVVILVGCGRIGFDPQTADGNGGDDGTSSVSCWSAWKDGSIAPSAPRRLDELAAPVAFDPALSSDGLTLYYATVVAGNTELERATRSALRAPWTPAGVIPELSTPTEETKLTIMGNDLYGVYASTRGSADFELYQVERTSPTDPFGMPIKGHVMPLETTRNEYDPHISFDGLHLYWAPVKPTGGQQLVLASRASLADDFAITRTIDELNDAADPAVSPDELVITMSVGVPSEVNYATRPTPTSTWGARQAIPVLNAVNDHDTDGEMSPDGCEIYFSSNRSGTRAIYVSTL